MPGSPPQPALTLRNTVWAPPGVSIMVFGRLIVQGGVTSGLLNALVADDMPGPGTVSLEVSWKFVKAVGIGDILTARAEVMTVRDDKPICTLRAEVVDNVGDTCLSGTATTCTVPLGR